MRHFSIRSYYPGHVLTMTKWLDYKVSSDIFFEKLKIHFSLLLVMIKICVDDYAVVFFLSNY